MYQTSTIVYCAIDTLIPQRGRTAPGFDEFSLALDVASIPVVWVTDRTRLQIDDPRRKFGHNHPFITEGGGGVCLPEGYFHLRPEKTLRLGRFTSIPIAEPQPAAAEALEALSEETKISAVPLRSLSPRELAQNSGLPEREAELLRQRDFDELFFFAGASDQDIDRFVAAGREKKYQLRRHGVLWSLAIGANLKQCIRELSKLYDRALRYHASILGIATSEDSEELLAATDRSLLLTTSKKHATEFQYSSKIRQFSLANDDTWEQILEGIKTKT
ncbi:MAG TPA: hypothetical protein VGI16_04785 [Candidatus Acidoferrum sp.]